MSKQGRPRNTHGNVSIRVSAPAAVVRAWEAAAKLEHLPFETWCRSRLSMAADNAVEWVDPIARGPSSTDPMGCIRCGNGRDPTMTIPFCSEQCASLMTAEFEAMANRP